MGALQLGAIWRPLARPAFRLVWLSKTLSLLADNIYLVALSWLVYELTGSGLALGGVLMVGAVPRGLLMLVGGAASDRFDPRVLLLISQAVRALLAAGVTAALLLGSLALWQLYLLAAAFGLVDAIAYPAALAALPRLVPPRQLGAANALVQGAEQICGIVGPVLAGALLAVAPEHSAIGLSGLPLAFGVTAGALAVGALAIAPALRSRGVGRAAQRAEPHEPLGRAIGAGLRFAWGEPGVRGALLIVAALNLAGIGPVIVGGTAMAEQRFGAGAAGFSALLAAYGVGALAGVVLAGARDGGGRSPHRRLVALAGALGVGLALLGLAPSLLIACLIIGAMGVASGYISVEAVTWLQRSAAREMQGRVLSLLTFAAVALDPVSYAMAGALVDRGPALLFAVAGGLLVAAAALAWGRGG